MINYTRIVTDEEQQMLEHDITDVADWITKAIEGKIVNCMKRAAKQFEEIAKKEDLASIPTKDIAKAKALFARTDYQNRINRIEE